MISSAHGMLSIFPSKCWLGVLEHVIESVGKASEMSHCFSSTDYEASARSQFSLKLTYTLSMTEGHSSNIRPMVRANGKDLLIKLNIK